MKTTSRPLDATPPRPDQPLEAPGDIVRFRVDVTAAHLANPLVAAARLLASEAGAFARIAGDEGSFEVSVARPAGADAAQVEEWVRWSVHNAGVRGPITRMDECQTA